MSVLVSILIPAYNCANTLRDCINSCLNQTYSNIEVLVLDNNSSDHSAEVLASFDDNRLKVITEKNNTGIAPARNKLLRSAAGEYIAWLDADDLMMHYRIERQVAFLEQFPSVDILGSWINTDDSELPSKQLPLHHHQIACCLWFKNCMIQPSVLSRNFYAKEDIFYDETYTNSLEDYELWYRLKGKKIFANIPEYLSVYHITKGRDHEMKKRANEFENNLRRLWVRKWQEYPIDISSDDKLNFQYFLYNNKILSSREVNSLSKTLLKLNQLNKDDFFRLITSYHFIRLWRNMKFTHKLINLHLLLNLRNYRKMKEVYLV